MSKSRDELVAEYEAKQIDLALKGDLSARLRVEVVLPFFHCVGAFTEKTKEMMAKYPGLSNEELSDKPEATEIYMPLVRTIASLVVIVVKSSANDLPTQILLLHSLMQMIGDIANDDLMTVGVMDALDKLKRKKP